MKKSSPRLTSRRHAMVAIADVLAKQIDEAVGGGVHGVEHIGSTSVPGLLAKPIVDLAIGLTSATDLSDVAEPLSRLGLIYRRDVGGWVFVLDDAPWHRVAHAHGVEYGGDQWARYPGSVNSFVEILPRDVVAGTQGRGLPGGSSTTRRAGAQAKTRQCSHSSRRRPDCRSRRTGSWRVRGPDGSSLRHPRRFSSSPPWWSRENTPT
jgi:hypothetical protein